MYTYDPDAKVYIVDSYFNSMAEILLGIGCHRALVSSVVRQPNPIGYIERNMSLNTVEA